MKIEVGAHKRAAQGTGASRRLRKSGWVPGIIYGGKAEAEPIQLDHNALRKHLKLEAFHSSILTMNLEGAKEQVLLRDVQMHPWRDEVAHVDFQRVAADEKIHIAVPLHFINAEIAPGVKISHGIVSHVMNELEITCLPKDLPEFIEVDLANLAAGHSLHLSDLKLPAGVEPSGYRGEDPVVATILIAKAVEEEAPAEAAPAAAEVPLAGAEKKEGKEG